MEDLNSREYLERVKGIVLQSLRDIGGPPSVQMMGSWCFAYLSSVHAHGQADIPQLPIDEALEDPDRDEDVLDSDIRRSRK